MLLVPATPTLPISTTSTSNNENVEPKYSKRPKTESSFGRNFVIIFLIEICDINYLDDLNKNLVQIFII